MNLWVRRAGLIFGLALFIFACDEPGEINLGLNPDQQNYVTGSVEIPIGVSVGLAESYLVSDTATSTGALLIGRHTDSIFGTVRAEAYAEPWLYEEKLSVGEDAEITSVQLSLILNAFYGYEEGVTGAQRFSVHELTEQIDKERSSSKDKYEYESEPLTEFELQLDSLVSSRTLTKSLSLDFGARILEKFSEVDTVKNDGYIHEFFKGFAFVPDDENDMLFNIDPRQFSTRLTVNYKASNVADTSFHLTFVSNLSYNVEADFTGTELEVLTPGAQPVATTGKGYLNAFSGVYSELDLSPIFALRDSIGPLVINRAEITFGSVPIDSLYPQSAAIDVFNKVLIPYFDQFPFFNPDQILLSRFGNGYLFRMERRANSENKVITYPFPSLEGYLQTVIKVPEVFENELKLVLIPSGYGRSFGRLVFDKDKIKFKLYYSYLKSTSSSTTD